MKKLTAAILCLLLLVTAVGCSPSQETYEEQKDAYRDILDQYITLLTAKHNGEALPELNTDGLNEQEAAIATSLHCIADRTSDTSIEQMGYGYKDMDGNGTPELFLLDSSACIRAVFTLSDGKPILLETIDDSPVSSMCFVSHGRILKSQRTENDSTQEYTTYVFHVSGDKTVYDAVYGHVRPKKGGEILERFTIVDEARTVIDEETYAELSFDGRKVSQIPYYDYKWDAPHIYFPLSDREVDPNRPVADFSDYDAIRKTYQAISTCVETFKVQDWARGKYDDLFTYPDDTSFESYIRLLRVTGGSRNIGYDEIDLNGDGQDELVLLTEYFNIKAIFTKKDGRPVLLGAFVEDICWLDEEGLIHVDSYPSNEAAFSVYELTADNDLRLRYSASVFDNINYNYYYYLTKDGETKPVSYEEWMIYYNDFGRHEELDGSYEHTRNVLALTYTPLIERTEDAVAKALGKTWWKDFDIETIPGQRRAWVDLYVTFSDVTDTKLAMEIRNVHSYSYPDPERDNYLLTESSEFTIRRTLRKENGAFVFEQEGVRGRVEFYHNYVWLIIEESTDSCFPVGFHLLTELT